MAGDFPFLVVLEVDLTINGTGSVSYSVTTQEELEIMEVFVQSTGVFDVTDIRTSDGQHYTNASSVTPIPGAFFPDVDNDYNAKPALPVPIHLSGGGVVYFDLLDTSGALNTVTMLLKCVRRFIA